MNYKRIIPFVALGALLATACDDSKMEWETPDPSTKITTAEIPLAMAEKISRYKALNTYAEMTLGIGIDLTTYLEDTVYANIVNKNFDQIVIGYHMKHAAMMKSTGVIDFTLVDSLIREVKDAGLSVYGHTLVWHSNQNASYLNSLVADQITITPDENGINLLTNGSFEDGFTGWNAANVAGSYSVSSEAISGSKSLEIVNTNNDGSQYKSQYQANFPTVMEKDVEYNISIWVKSEASGSFRLSFPNTMGNYQDCHYQNNETTSGTWTEYKYSFKAEGYEKGISIDIGAKAGTYYVDNIKVSPKTAPNLITNGSFEDDFTGWNAANKAGSYSISTEAIAGSKSLQIINTNDDGTQYKSQYQADFATVMTKDVTYNISIWVKSEATGSFRLSFPNTMANYQDCHYQNDETTSGTWTEYKYSFKAEGYEKGISIDIGAKAGTYYIDNIVVSEAPVLKSAPRKAVIITPKTDAEKAQIIGDAMESWIKQMMEHYKGDVKSWDVVNEPIGDDGKRRDGNVSDMPSDNFYWVKYLGDDYAVKAFQLARQYGNEGDVYFINDYNLEHSLAKCQALIDYVAYIDANGAHVDGIGTQMHININTKKEDITQMFTLLAATGKQIKISELDVMVQAKAPTAEQYAKQAEMYQFVVDQYRTIIPAAQQFGITVWGVSDAVEEHVNWIPDDAPNLWDAKYQRKLAYKTFADGLAGKDVSLEFSGDLQK